MESSSGPACGDIIILWELYMREGARMTNIPAFLLRRVSEESKDLDVVHNKNKK